MKVQVNVSDEMVEGIDKYAKAMGVSRSALCSMWIGQGKMAFDKSFEITEKWAEQHLKDELSEKKIAEK